MTKKIKLAFSGSGPRFPVFAGAFKRLEEEGIEVTKVIGTSGGSIIAASIASGMKADQIIKLCQEIMPKLGSMVAFNPFNLLSNWGLDNGNKIQAELSKHFVKTFKETKIPLFVTATNFDTQDSEIFHTTHNPNMEVAKAVRMSMSMPVVFTPVEHKGSLYVDGGVKYNFPIDYFINEPDVFGFYFNDSLGGTRRPRPKGLFSSVAFISRIIDMMIGAKTEDDLSDGSRVNAITVSTDIEGLDFNLSKEDVNKMIRQGYEACDKWLKKNPGKLK